MSYLRVIVFNNLENHSRKYERTIRSIRNCNFEKTWY